MSLSPASGSNPTNSAAWNAIASMKATSPFNAGGLSTSSVADEFDGLIDHSAADALDGAAPASTAAQSGSAAQLAALRQVQNAQQSTIDLFA